jgi:DNA repair exonuclease SbcCD ATPase subunit
MEIKLMKLILQNFKGVRNLAVEPQGQDLVFRGDNGTGKTTNLDGFLWLLFGKDSQGRSDFALKTLDDQGREIHGLDHSVEAELLVDGKTVTLRKSYREKWTKKRGSPNSTLTGHTTEHFIDGVPCKKGEWDTKINSLIDESTFKLLTSPTYFNSLHWEKRRQILLQVCGDIEDQDVIASNADLAKLPDILGDRSLEDHKKVVTARKREINKRLQEIPARIDELSKSMSDVSEYSPRLIKDRIMELEQKIEQTKAGDGKADLYRKKSELEAELSRLRTEADQAVRERTKGIQDELYKLQDQQAKAQREKSQASQDLEQTERSISQGQARMQELRTKYKEVAAKEAQADDSCPTCGQGLPEDQVQAAIDRFNQGKAEQLRHINEEGKQLKTKVQEAESKKESLQQQLKDLAGQVEALHGQITDKQSELSQSQGQPSPNAERIREVQAEIQGLNEQLSQENNQADTSGIEQELEQERGKLATIEGTKKSQARIQELKDEEKNLANEYEDLESQTYLMEQFVVSKVNLLEGKINSKFALARFKLFEEQINGGISETCETLYQGVPYGSGLNSGARTNVGLDIIRTLSDHYQVKVPVFVDNAESVTDLINPGSQTIKLVVDANYPALHIETQAQKEAA